MEENEKKNQEELNDTNEQEANAPWYREYIETLKNIIDLRDGLDRYGTITSIRKNIHLKGNNVWMLVCSIMVASIGLDQSSVAVIIGGMLISPLMYPILGLGLSVAMNDKENLIKSVKNFSIAVVVALVTSVIYFAITPFGMENSEILARTQPDLRDVFVGFFGGIAGIVAGSRKDVSSAIPGVAIATALLPPLCVAGYGLANFDFAIFGGAFYLFLMNTFFIMIATYLVVRYLKFPYKQHATEAQRKRARQYMVIAAALMILPSIGFLIRSVKEVRAENHVRAFIADSFEKNEHINVITSAFVERDTSKAINITLQIDDRLSQEQIDSLKHLMKTKYKIKNTALNLTQIEVTEREISEIKDDQSAFKSDIEKALDNFKTMISEKDKQLSELKDAQNEMNADSIVFVKLKDVLKIWYPDLKEISVGEMWTSDFEDQNKTLTIVLGWEKKYYQSVLKERSEKVTTYVLNEFPFLDTVFIQQQ